jgi:NTE family protein
VITNQGFGAQVKKWMMGALLTLALLLAGDFIFLGLQRQLPGLAILTKSFFVASALFLLLIGVFLFYCLDLLKRLKNAGFGINPGDYFYDWIKAELRKNGIQTVTQLQDKASTPVPGIYLRVPNEEGTDGLNGDVTFITSELVTQNKIQFPEMWDLFRINKDELQPAGFVRASMSIPVFFESYFINEIPCKEQVIKDKWMERFGVKEPPSTARFVDGGILSNFPINLFYNPKVAHPRLPSFGIDLNDGDAADAGMNAESWSLAGYAGRMFNTIRFYYDKDFLLKNKVYQKGIGTIPLAGYNWLNFFLKDEDKIDMFVRGAKAATEFLISFDWEDYKNDREAMRQELTNALK